MSDSRSVASFDSLDVLLSHSQVTVRRPPATTDHIFERVRQFVQLYDQLASKPSGVALLYPQPGGSSPKYRELDSLLTVGRLSKSERNPHGSDLALEDEQMSRRHFQIDFSDDFYILRDLQSRNGTYLNDDPVSIDERVLKAGDVIQAGASIFVFTGPAFATPEELLLR